MNVSIDGAYIYFRIPIFGGINVYKENPDKFKGHVGDISMVLRVALSSKSMTPNLYQIMKLFGRERLVNRFNLVINK